MGQGGYALLAFFVGAQVVLHAACGASMKLLLLLSATSVLSRRGQLRKNVARDMCHCIFEQGVTCSERHKY